MFHLLVFYTKGSYSTLKYNFYSNRPCSKAIPFDSVCNSNELILPWVGTALPPRYLPNLLSAQRRTHNDGQGPDQNCVKKTAVWKGVPATNWWPGLNKTKNLAIVLYSIAN